MIKRQCGTVGFGNQQFLIQTKFKISNKISQQMEQASILQET